MAFLAEVLLAAALDARARGDRRAERYCYRDVLKADPHNAVALAGIASLDEEELRERETQVSVPPHVIALGADQLPVPLLEGFDLEELPPEAPPEPAPFIPSSPRAEKFSATRAPKPLIHIAARAGAPEPLRHASERISIFTEPFQPPRPHLEAAGRSAPHRHRAMVALLTGLALLLTTHAL